MHCFDCISLPQMHYMSVIALSILSMVSRHVQCFDVSVAGLTVFECLNNQ